MIRKIEFQGRTYSWIEGSAQTINLNQEYRDGAFANTPLYVAELRYVLAAIDNAKQPEVKP